MFLLRSLLVLLFLISDGYAEIQDKKETTNLPTNEKPLVLQWEVSHSLNVDQTSLIFRQDTVELVTNTHSYQSGDEVRLGWFQSPMNADLERLQHEVRHCRVGGGAPWGWPPSAAQTARTVFP